MKCRNRLCGEESLLNKIYCKRCILGFEEVANLKGRNKTKQNKIQEHLNKEFIWESKLSTKFLLVLLLPSIYLSYLIGRIIE